MQHLFNYPSYASLERCFAASQSSPIFISLIATRSRKPASRLPYLGFNDVERPIDHQLDSGKSVDKAATMSGRYAFAKGLKEVRFLFCQTGDHSSATRCVMPFRRSRGAHTDEYLHAGPSSHEPTRS